MNRRLTSLISAIALVFAVAAPPAFACESATMEKSEAAPAMAGSMHLMDGDTQTDCPESDTPASEEHDSDCLATCLSMTGCSSPSFVTESTLAGVVDHESLTPATPTPPHPSRYSVPDRPPPRI